MAHRDVRRNGLDGMVLESDEVSLSVFPAAGGKIMDLVHRPSGRNLLWHNPRVGLAATNPGAPFDDVWCGGWDEVFPTDPPCADETNSYHDHGDLWIGPWSATLDGENALVLERASASLPCVMTKRLEVVGNAVHVSYRLVNTGYAAFDYMWDIHVAHAIRPGSRIEVTGSPEWFPEEPFPGRTGQSGADLMVDAAARGGIHGVAVVAVDERRRRRAPSRRQRCLDRLRHGRIPLPLAVGRLRRLAWPLRAADGAVHQSSGQPGRERRARNGRAARGGPRAGNQRRDPGRRTPTLDTLDAIAFTPLTVGGRPAHTTRRRGRQ